MTDKIRMIEWLAIALALFGVIGLVAPEQLSVVVYKVALVTLFAHIGYWIYRRLFATFGREEDAWSVGREGFPALMLSRAIFVVGVILAGAMAL